MLLLLLLLGAALLLFCSLDVWYFLRGARVFIEAWFQPQIRDILAEQTVDGIVLPHDLDYMGHMNNSRYLRECDFARFHHYMRNGIFMASFKLGAKMVVGASTIRYRRSLAFREAFEIRTKVLGWDDKAFYLEQRFVSKKDGFVSAIMLCRQNMVRHSPESIIEFNCKKKVSWKMTYFIIITACIFCHLRSGNLQTNKLAPDWDFLSLSAVWKMFFVCRSSAQSSLRISNTG